MPRTLVFGASLNPNRYSNLVIHRLVEKGIDTLAFGLKSGLVDNVQIKTNLTDLQDVHTITLYLNGERQKEYYQSILSLRPKRVIFNPGTENQEFYELLQKNGIKVEVACTLVLLSTGQY
ncbi:MAG: CoA-binding protein [Croceitalea sp.]|nr:CoA-binding protein [Croceitalea sp.]